MGDAPLHNVRPSDYQHGGLVPDDSQQNVKPTPGQQSGQNIADNAQPFHAQFSGLPPQHRVDLSRLQTGGGPYNFAQSQGQGGSSFNMDSMVGALPDYSTAPQSQRGPSSAGSAQSATFRGQPMGQYSANSPYGPSYGMGQFQTGVSPDDAGHSSMGHQSQRPGGLLSMQQPFSPYGQQLPQYYYPTSPFSPPSAQQAFFPGSGQNLQSFDRRTSLGSLQSPQGGFVGSQMQNPGISRPLQGMPGYSDQYGSTSALSAGEGSIFPRTFVSVHRELIRSTPAGIQRPASGNSSASIPRGPPRKPKQSGHALWVGNLPPGTTVLDLKDHFSRDATKDIESLFLISKSNCAFVNYRTEASCTAAMQRFHDSRFHGVRLVCRLRRGSAAPSGVPSGPASMTGGVTSPNLPAPSSPTAAGAEQSSKPPDAEPESLATEPPPPGEKVQDKFFVVKSLTLQDLELSVRNGIWATQAHNEESLNKAFESAENVYLIFSANKSGEYFGYARMASAISEDATQVFGTVQRHEPVEALDVPRTIPTQATEFAPKGHIIDDSARGTIFWEADHSDEEDLEEVKESPEGAGQPIEGDSSGGPQAWGKPFKVEWISTNRLPFYRTRGLRNPWNANREVKIARDGTELEPNVGHRLIQMFHRMGQPAAAPGQMQPLQQMAQMPPQMGGPPQHMRPF